ncbi:MAG: ABC transporter permease [Thermoflexales bacterium]|nr:ABC transporter permease [Thermoflexales bacterium]
MEQLLEALRNINYIFLLAVALRAATPIVFAALGGIFSERAGVVNIALEGMMLTSAYVSFRVAVMAGSPWVGLVGGIIAAVLVAALHAVVSIRYRTNQVVSGTVINIFAAGVTGYLYRAFPTTASADYLPDLFPASMKNLPVVGSLIFDQGILTYAMLIGVFLTGLVLFRTRWGLRTRAVGELPRAADTAGINVNRTRFINVLISGALAGLGGAFFTLQTVSTFSPNMTSGQGYIGLAAMIFGNWNPVPALFASLLFTIPQALAGQFQLFNVPLPYQLLSTLPYLLTIITLAGFMRRSTPPAADGIPYP